MLRAKGGRTGSRPSPHMRDAQQAGCVTPAADGTRMFLRGGIARASAPAGPSDPPPDGQPDRRADRAAGSSSSGRGAHARLPVGRATAKPVRPRNLGARDPLGPLGGGFRDPWAIRALRCGRCRSGWPLGGRSAPACPDRRSGWPLGGRSAPGLARTRGAAEAPGGLPRWLAPELAGSRAGRLPRWPAPALVGLRRCSRATFQIQAAPSRMTTRRGAASKPRRRASRSTRRAKAGSVASVSRVAALSMAADQLTDPGRARAAPRRRGPRRSRPSRA